MVDLLVVECDRLFSLLVYCSFGAFSASVLFLFSLVLNNLSLSLSYVGCSTTRLRVVWGCVNVHVWDDDPASVVFVVFSLVCCVSLIIFRHLLQGPGRIVPFLRRYHITPVRWGHGYS